ncbi:hypothetical protein B0H16DRAFT_747146 [Mycena metata]|uniref:Restriction endonuclease domain-containing protein n=1 Tax=Mycena metata TaxID=1033252 RepID=A0AAD7J0W9_9AGAR|nr:hypothetical protein B0H16DRAFT_747146 [Mycena metata]
MASSLELPRYVTLKSVRNDLQRAVKSETPLHYGVRIEAEWEQVEKALTRCSKRVRLGHDAQTQELILKYMPSLVHETATQVLTNLISMEYYTQQQHNILQHCTPCGATRYKLNSKRVKEPNQSFSSNARQIDALPMFVIEVGVSESYTQLKRDADWWLETGDVHIVILVIVQSAASKALSIEIWESTPSPQPPGAGDVPAFVARLRSGRLEYLQGQGAPSLVLNYADLGIPNIPGALTVPMAEWSTLVWAVLS